MGGHPPCLGAALPACNSVLPAQPSGVQQLFDTPSPPAAISASHTLVLYADCYRSGVGPAWSISPANSSSYATLLGPHLGPTSTSPSFSKLQVRTIWRAPTHRRVSTCDGLAWSPFDRSMLATNDALYSKVGHSRCYCCCCHPSDTLCDQTLTSSVTAAQGLNAHTHSLHAIQHCQTVFVTTWHTHVDPHAARCWP